MMVKVYTCNVPPVCAICLSICVQDKKNLLHFWCPNSDCKQFFKKFQISYEECEEVKEKNTAA